MNPHLRSVLRWLTVAIIATAAAIEGGEVSAGIPINSADVPAPGAPRIDTAAFAITLLPKGSYETVRKSILSRKNYVSHSFRNSSADIDTRYNLAKATLEQCIVNELIPFWYGTRWDFNGYTKVPRSGTVACGYFVSTVLLHCGFSLNRYTLAQQAPFLEAVTLQLDDSIQEFHGSSANFIEHFKRNNPEGLYFIGLDFHVGFLLLKSGRLLFLHAAYYDPLCVTAEEVTKSPGFAASSTFYVAGISTNRKLLDCWLNDTKIITRTE